MPEAEADGLGKPVRTDGGVLGAMIKQTPSIGRMVAMAAFTLSVFAILIFLWLAFGGTVPLKPEGYRFTVHMPEAATLAEEADVRMAGVNVGKVKSKELDKGGARTIVEVELDEAYAPIPKDTHAILRQKTLLGETYLELAPGNKSGGMLDDGGRLANSQVEPTVELDEIFSAFDPGHAEGVPGVGQGARRRDHRGPPQRGPERRVRELRGLRRRRRQAAAGARRAERRRARPDQEHRPGVRRDQRAPRRAARADRQLEADLRGHRLPRRGPGRDVRDLPDLPRRVARPPWRGSRTSRATPTRSVNDLKAPGRRPRADGPRPGRPGARPREPVPRPRPADPREPHAACRRSSGRCARRRAAGRGPPHVLPGAQPDPVLLQLPPDHDRRLHHERRRRPRGGLRDGPARPDADGHHRGPLVPALQVRRRPARLGARQRLHASQLADARAEARDDRELQVPGRRAEAADRRHEAGREPRRQAGALLRAAPVPVRREDVHAAPRGVAPLRSNPKGFEGNPPARTPSPATSRNGSAPNHFVVAESLRWKACRNLCRFTGCGSSLDKSSSRMPKSASSSGRDAAEDIPVAPFHPLRDETRVLAARALAVLAVLCTILVALLAGARPGRWPTPSRRTTRGPRTATATSGAAGEPASRSRTATPAGNGNGTPTVAAASPTHPTRPTRRARPARALPSRPRLPPRRRPTTATTARPAAARIPRRRAPARRARPPTPRRHRAATPALRRPVSRTRPARPAPGRQGPRRRRRPCRSAARAARAGLAQPDPLQARRRQCRIAPRDPGQVAGVGGTLAQFEPAPAAAAPAFERVAAPRAAVTAARTDRPPGPPGRGQTRRTARRSSARSRSS